MSDFVTGFNNFTKQVQQTLSSYEVRRLGDKVTGYVMNFTDAEVKVREATNEDPWGPTGPQMQELANMTFQYDNFSEIMGMLWKRMFQENKLAWRRVYKSLILLNHLIKNGSERCIVAARDHMFELRSLESYKCVDERGRDEGANVRHRVKQILELLSDDEALRHDRRKAKAEGKDKYQGFSREEMMFGGGGGGGGKSFRSASQQRSNGSGKFDDPPAEGEWGSASGREGGRREVTAFDFRDADHRQQSGGGSPELGIREAPLPRTPDLMSHAGNGTSKTNNAEDDDDDEFGDFTQARGGATRNASSNKKTTSSPPPPIPPPSGAGVLPKGRIVPPRRPSGGGGGQADLLGLGNDIISDCGGRGDDGFGSFGSAPPVVGSGNAKLASQSTAAASIIDPSGWPSTNSTTTTTNAAPGVNKPANSDLDAILFGTAAPSIAPISPSTVGMGGMLDDDHSLFTSMPVATGASNNNSISSAMPMSQLLVESPSLMMKNGASAPSVTQACLLPSAPQGLSDQRGGSGVQLSKTWDDLKKVNIDFDTLSLRPASGAKAGPSLLELQQSGSVNTMLGQQTSATNTQSAASMNFPW